MPIKVTCQCGKSFAAKDELAGKTVKCPSCQKPLRIPAAADASATAAPAKKPAQRAAPQPEPKPASDTDDPFADIGLAPQEVGTRPCPGCGSGLAPDAVVCIRCGYNTKLGRRMETVKVGGGEEGEAGHGAVAAGLMERAAVVIDEDKAEERKKTKEGMPWWVWLIGLIIVGGFISYMVIRANRLEEKAAKEKEKGKGAFFAPAPATVVRSTSEGVRSNISENSV